MAESPFDKLPATDRIDPTKEVGQQTQKPPNEELFRNYMDQAAGLIPEGVERPEAKPPILSPFELAPPTTPLAAGPNFETLITQTGATEAAFHDLRDLLQTPNLHLRQAETFLLNNKLTDANSNLHAAAEKLGAELVPLSQAPPSLGPIEKFLLFIGDGERQLASAQTQLRTIQAKGENINPADFLLMQIKLNKAQQEVEFSSMVLSKALEGIKTIMQIQI